MTDPLERITALLKALDSVSEQAADLRTELAGMLAANQDRARDIPTLRLAIDRRVRNKRRLHSRRSND
jgi:hypothetical protein